MPIKTIIHCQSSAKSPFSHDHLILRRIWKAMNVPYYRSSRESYTLAQKKTPPFRGILRLATTYTRTRKETPKEGALRRVLLCLFTGGRNFSMPQSTDASEHGRWLCQMRGRRIFRVGISWLLGCWSSRMTARRNFPEL